MRTKMNSLLSRDDVIDILEATQQGENCLCSSDWLKAIAFKITNTLNEFEQLKDQIIDNNKKDIVNKEIIANVNEWSGQLMYKHRGFSLPRFEDLGIIFSESKKEADLEANSRAQKLIDEILDKKEILYWDVKVKPSNVK